jgi:NAD+ synthase (glutamine-hydrolysing)
MPTLKFAAASVNQTPLDWTGNFNRITAAINRAKELHADLLCFPEVAITGYGSEDLFLSYWYPQQAMKQIQKLLPYCADITVAVGVPVRVEEKLYNCMAVIENCSVIGFVAKQYMAIDGVHYEFRWFTPWEAGKVVQLDFCGTQVPLGDLVFTKKDVSYGFEICEDAWRGSLRPGYRLSDRNVDLIFNPSASHFAMGKSKLREELVMESSLLFHSTYCYVNLLGNEAGRMIFDGEIMVARNGQLLLKNELLSFKDYQVLTFDYGADLPALDTTVQPDKNIEFTQATALALFDYLRKSRSKGFVLSLSGGADSSTIAILVAEMVNRGIHDLGQKEFLSKLNLDIKTTTANPIKEITGKLLTTAYQSSENSSFATFQSAKLLAESLGAEFLKWEISQEVQSYTEKIETAIGRKMNWKTDDIALQNIQARARSPIIWMLTNVKQALLLSTSNRSEGDVGYTTMDGDTSGSISPIAGVDKYFILQFLKWAEITLGYSALKHVNDLQPTAELRPNENNQTDETDLMPYAVIVEIERLAIRDRRSPVDVYLNLKTELNIQPEVLKGYIKKFFKLWSINQWKRERLAPSFHLDEFNVDPKTWCRFPILSGGFEEELKELESTF